MANDPPPRPPRKIRTPCDRILNWSPIIAFVLFREIIDSKWGALIALVLAVLVGCVYHFIQKRRKVIAVFPKSFVILQVLVFFAMVWWGFLGNEEDMDKWCTTVLFAIYMVYAGLTIVIKRPFVAEFAKDVTPEERWDTPIFKQICMELTIMWAGAFAIMTAGSILDALISGNVADIIFQYIMVWGVLALAIILSKLYPMWRRRNLQNKPPPAPYVPPQPTPAPGSGPAPAAAPTHVGLEMGDTGAPTTAPGSAGNKNSELFV